MNFLFDQKYKKIVTRKLSENITAEKYYKLFFYKKIISVDTKKLEKKFHEKLPQKWVKIQVFTSFFTFF